MKKVLIINANPKSASLNKSLSLQYADSASKNHEVVTVHIGSLDFDINLKDGYDSIQELEPDLLQLQEHIKWADHIVIFSPVWWGTIPAIFKGVLDRILLPGFAFKYVENKSIPEKLLSGKTSQIFVTMDTPVLWYKLVKGNLIYKHLKKGVLDFTGIKNNSINYFGPVISSSEKKRASWIKQVDALAARL